MRSAVGVAQIFLGKTRRMTNDGVFGIFLIYVVLLKLCESINRSLLSTDIHFLNFSFALIRRGKRSEIARAGLVY